MWIWPIWVADDGGMLNRDKLRKKSTAIPSPAWLGNNDVRDGIKALVEHDRFVEEINSV